MPRKKGWRKAESRVTGWERIKTGNRVATVREKSLENNFFSRSGKSQGISIIVREI